MTYYRLPLTVGLVAFMAHAANADYTECADPDFSATWDPVYTHLNYPDESYDTISFCDGSIISKIEIWTGTTHIGGLRFTVTYYPAEEIDSSTGAYKGQFVVGTPGSDTSAQILDLENGTIEKTTLLKSDGGNVVSGFVVTWTDKDGMEQTKTLSAKEKNGTPAIATPTLGKLVGVKTIYDPNKGWLNDMGFIFMHEPDSVVTTSESPLNYLDDSMIETVYDSALCQRIENVAFSQNIKETFSEVSEQTWTEEQSVTSVVGNSQTVDVSVEAGIQGSSTTTGASYTFYSETEQSSSSGSSETYTEEFSREVDETVSWSEGKYSELVEQYTSDGTIGSFQQDAEGDYVFCYNVFVQWGEAEVGDITLAGESTFYYGDRAPYSVDVTNDYSGVIRSDISAPADDIAAICYDSAALVNCAGLPQTLP